MSILEKAGSASVFCGTGPFLLEAKLQRLHLETYLGSGTSACS